MSRRSTPQTKLDDAAFPVRIRVAVPDSGFGGKLDQMFAWLRDNLARGDYAHSSGGRIAGDKITDVMSFYFRDPDAGAAFVQALDLQLADGTASKTYSRPYMVSKSGWS